MGEPRAGARGRMEARLGPLGRGARRLTVAGQAYTLPDDIDFEGCRTIDGFELDPAHFAVRYHDPDEQRIVVHEFDAGFRYLTEMRVHVAEWVGDGALAPGDGPEEEARWIST
jgi:hypothetical protein